MSLTFDDQECAVLEQALGYYVPQLRQERAAAEARDAQHALAVLETALEHIQRRLQLAKRETAHAR